jgi:hypothetical protein
MIPHVRRPSRRARLKVQTATRRRRGNKNGSTSRPEFGDQERRLVRHEVADELHARQQSVAAGGLRPARRRSRASGALPVSISVPGTAKTSPATRAPSCASPSLKPRFCPSKATLATGHSQYPNLREEAARSNRGPAAKCIYWKSHWLKSPHS